MSQLLCEIGYKLPASHLSFVPEEEMPNLYLLMVHHHQAWLSVEGGMTTEEPNNIVTVKQT